MTAALLFGTLAGLGLLLVVRGLSHRPASLTVVVSRLNRAAFAELAATPGGHRVPARLLGTALFARLRSGVTPSTAADLRMVGRTVDRHVFDKLSCATAMVVLPPALARSLVVVGLASPGGLTVVVLAALVGGAGGFILPEALLRSHARARRSSFEHALSSYLDLVNVLLAGGAGVETALEAAADAGDGPTFRELRTALVRARATRRSHWDVFGEVGAALAVEPLVELAASMQLAGVEGARVRLSLAAKAASLRARQMAQIEATAQSASERMGLPVAAMFLGFLVFLAYPAVQQIVAS